MNKLLKKIGLLDTLTITFTIPKTVVIERLKMLIDEDKPFDSFNKGKQRFKGEINNDSFSFRLKTGFFQFNFDSDNFVKVSGTLKDINGLTKVDCIIEGQTLHLIMTLFGFSSIIFVTYFICDLGQASWNTTSFLVLIGLVFAIQQLLVIRKGISKMKRLTELELINIKSIT